MAAELYASAKTANGANRTRSRVFIREFLLFPGLPEAIERCCSPPYAHGDVVIDSRVPCRADRFLLGGAPLLVWRQLGNTGSILAKFALICMSSLPIRCGTCRLLDFHCAGKRTHHVSSGYA